MVAQRNPVVTEADYLHVERASETKHEYYAGHIVAQAGTSERHNRIAVNLLAGLHPQLRKRQCNVYSSDMRVHIPQSRSYTYPDVSILCGVPQFSDAEKDTLLNPIVIIEILSPSTERYDRGQKFINYRRIPTLQEYILVSQDKRLVEQYIRQANDTWLLIAFTHLQNTLSLDSVQCQMILEDIYADVEFDTDLMGDELHPKSKLSD